MPAGPGGAARPPLTVTGSAPPPHGNVATWSYWHDAAPLAAAPSGAIGVFSLPVHGWLWAIPLHDGSLSVGLVTDKRSFAHARQAAGGSLQSVYDEAIARCPLLAGMLAHARQTAPLKTESDYSYVSEAFSGPGWFLAGDAACFLDPLLSTGVHLALYSGLLAAASISSVHGRRRRSRRPRLLPDRLPARLRKAPHPGRRLLPHPRRPRHLLPHRPTAQPPRPGTPAPARELPRHHHRSGRPPRHPDRRRRRHLPAHRAPIRRRASPARTRRPRNNRPPAPAHHPRTRRRRVRLGANAWSGRTVTPGRDERLTVGGRPYGLRRKVRSRCRSG